MGEIVWLASYPKSGNTWLRVFLASYWNNGQPVDINNLRRSRHATAQALFEEAVGLDPSVLTAEEIARLRPEAYRHLAYNSGGTLFIKIHDAYTGTPDDQCLIPPEVSRGVVYLLRNPLDVAVSFAHYFRCSVDAVIKRMTDDSFSLYPVPTLPDWFQEQLLTWSHHVLSWVDQTEIPLHVVRYEDMHDRPTEIFAAVVRFVGLTVDMDLLRRAIEASRFARLREQELERGFRESLPDTPSFFRKGQVGDWRNVLAGEQVARILQDHGEVMRRFGYLTEAGEPEWEVVARDHDREGNSG